MYRIKIRRDDFEVEVEGDDRAFVEEAIREHVKSPEPPPAGEHHKTQDRVRTDKPLAGDKLSMLAAKLGLGRDVTGEVFHPEGDDMKLIVGASKLPSDKAVAARQIAILVAAGRQGSGVDDEWTSTKVIRQVTDDFGRFDSKNFATTVARMGDVFSFSGKGQERKVKVNRPGFDRAKAIVEDLTGANKK